MKFNDYKHLILSDLYRHKGDIRAVNFLGQMFFGHTFPYNFWFRTCQYLKSSPVLKYTLYYAVRLILNHYIFKLGISIQASTEIGSGFYIGHFGGIVVNKYSKIGNNCNISNDVTLGQANRGRNKGYPVIGNNVYIGPGAKIVGAVKVGNNAAIGANCVVTKDVPDNAVVVGVPGRIISYEGSQGYVDYTNYEDKI
jgi:serine O-acetyltransferase